ncbi:HepT-like ribonuclease domain-containing protein [Parafrankia sp. EAN1pec]|uniref:HepT-like ribonuclease domain-containing protein n=1 Tax=Parafrankia sp. (strain EAN1pec) TaxID=298653 RepID=UPI00321BDBD1
MIEAAVAAAAFVQDVDEAAFLESDLIQSAVLQKLLVIGEAAGRVSPEIRGRWPDLPWRSVTGFRNIAITHTSRSTGQLSGELPRPLCGKFNSNY